jgi:hypothetical protein
VSQFSVFATKDLALPDSNLAFASCECASCGTPFAVQASLEEPFCVHCGADDVKVLPQPVTASVHQLVADQDPSFVTCAGCDNHLVISSAMEQAGALFCPCCGTSATHAGLDEGVSFGAESEGRTEVHMHSGEQINPQAPLDKDHDNDDRLSNPAAAKRDEHNHEHANWDHLEDIDDSDLDDLDDEDDLDDLVDIIGEDDDYLDSDFPPDELSSISDEELSNLLNELDNTVAKIAETASGCEFKVGDAQKVIDSDNDSKDRVSNPAAAETHEHHHEVPVEAKKHDEKDEKDEKHGKHMKKEESNVTNPPGAEGRLPEFEHPSAAEVFDHSAAKDKLEQKHVNPDGTDNSVNRDAYPASDHPAISLLDIVRTSEKGEPPIRIGRVEATILAYVGNYTVAALEKEQVNAQYQQHFDRQEYLQAIANSVQIAGLDQTLADFGFKLLTVKANNEAIASLHQSRVETAAATLVAGREEASVKEIRNTMAVALAGFTKDFWNESNPLQVELCQTLEGVGLHTAAKVVNQAIASAGDQYADLVLAKTFELLEMPVEARNAIASTIMGSKHIAAREEKASVKPSVSYSDLASSLSNPMLGVAETASVAQPVGRQSGSPVQRTVDQFRQSGRRLFNNR